MKIIDCQQYTPEWWLARRGLPTASVASRIITPAKGEYSKSADGLICELLAQQYDPSYGVYDDYQTAAMKNGSLLEPEARRFYEFHRNADVIQVGFCTTDDGTAGCSPDGLIGDDGLLEIKSPEAKTQVAYLLGGGLPAEYKPQVHWHLAVTGRAWCDFISYSRGLPPLLLRIVPDDYTKQVRAHMARFVAELAEAREKLSAVIGAVTASTADAASKTACAKKNDNDVALFGSNAKPMTHDLPLE